MRLLMSRETYDVRVTRQGTWWIVEVPAVDYRTQARGLAEVDEMARSLVAGALEIAEDSFDLAVDIEQPADVAARLAEAAAHEREAQAVTARAARDRREAARALRDVHGLSAIDSARVLGISRARVYQLLNDTDKATA